MTAPKTSIACFAVAALAGCGGSSDSGGNGGNKSAGTKPNTPTVPQAVAVARKNPGLDSCKKVSSTALKSTPADPSEPLTILAITCDGKSVGLWERFRNPQAAAHGGEIYGRRPYLLNGNVKVSTGEAVFAGIDADAWKTMPAELKAACNCGEVRQPTK